MLDSDKMQLEDFKIFFEALKEQGNFERNVKLFKTRNNGYLYDLGTGKVLMCDNNEFDVLSNIITNNGLESLHMLQISEGDLFLALNSIKAAIISENLFKAPKLTEFATAHTKFDLMKNNIENNLEQITLELTEECNLRCKYCIYTEDNTDYRNFNIDSMSWDIAKAAIDYGIEHSGESLAITFYGGEPLLKFGILKQCIEYSKPFSRKKTISYSLTTNLTLVTKEIAEYFSSLTNITIVCSLDGPKEVHDMNRTMINKEGSFDKAIRGLKLLVDAFADRASVCLSLSMVMTLPVTDKKMTAIQNFFDELEWLPMDVRKNISYAHRSSHRYERLSGKTRVINNNQNSEYCNPIADWSLENTTYQKNIDNKNIFTKTFIKEEFLRIHRRLISNEPVGYYNLTGCCIPGSRRLYITVRGDFMLCERIGNSPTIGNVYKGVDYRSIEKHYVNDYVNEAKKSCSQCWAIRLCNVCYVDCYNKAGFKAEFKQDLCAGARYAVEKALIDYHEVLERYPEELEYLNHIVFK